MLYEGIYVTVGYPDLSRKIVQVKKFSSGINEEINYMDFIWSALQNSNITFEDFSGFANYQDADIDPDIFESYVKQFIHHPAFILKLKTKTILNLNQRPAENSVGNSVEKNNIRDLGILRRSNACIGPSLIITSGTLKQYICKKACGKDILRNFNLKKSLTDNERRRIITYLVNYLEENFGFKPSREEQISGCEACVSLFPCLKTTNTKSEIELLFNAKNTGYLQVKLKNDRVRKRKLDKEFDETNVEPAENIEQVTEENEEFLKRDLEFLKTAVLPDELILVKEKLKSTLSLRRRLVERDKSYLSDSFNYYFTCPELISFDYSLSFPNCEKTVATEWHKYQCSIFNVIRTSGKKVLYTESERENDWNAPTLSFLNLLRALPPAPNGKKKVRRLSDEKAINRLLIYDKPGRTNAEYLQHSSGKSPFIIAIGNEKSNINQYMIIVDSEIIPVNPTYSFLDCVDIVFKLHFLLNIEYDSNLRLTWMFIQNFIYGISCPVTPIVQELYNKLSVLITDK